MPRRTSQNELIKCPYCGELYSTTYKTCPFCNGDGTGHWDDPDTAEPDYEEDSRGGKRLLGGGPGGDGPSVGKIVFFVVSLALILAAVCIVVSLLKPLVGGKKTPGTSASPVPSASASVVPSPAGTETVSPSAPMDSAAPATSPAAATPSAAPAGNGITPTGFTLNREDFTFDHVGEIFDMRATFTPADASAEITWSSSDPNIAAVSWNGRVTAVSQGTITLTATVAGLEPRTCIVRCSFTENTPAASTAPAPAESSAAAASGLTLSREDFTLSYVGDSWRLVVSGTSSAVTWSSSDPSVATVGGDGTVTAVSQGTCKVSATVDGVTLKCIVRCNFD